MAETELILFDLDGTLIDTTPLILESFKHTFLYHFNEKKEDRDIMRYLGIPLKYAFGEKYPDLTDILIKTYKEYNEMRHDRYIGVFIGIRQMLEELRRRGLRLGLVTSKSRQLALRGLKLFCLEDFMEVFVGMEDTDRHKPDPDPILRALKLSGADREGVIYVGDSPYDVLCAKNAGVRSAVAGWSYLPKCEMDALKPDIFLERPRDLLDYI